MEKAYWETSIINVQENQIIIRGYDLAELIGQVSYVEALYLFIKGELPSKGQAKLLEAVLVAGSDHGVTSPAIAIARMAATCGISFNSCVATGMNVLGDVHGGATEEGMFLLYSIVKEASERGVSTKEIAKEKIAAYKTSGHFIPGYGHPLHTRCPRVKRLFELAKKATSEGLIQGIYIRVAEEIEEVIPEVYGKSIPINIDGGKQIIQCELGLPPEVAKGLVSLSRGIGLVAHALEERLSGSRLKAPAPVKDIKERYERYIGPSYRQLPPEYND